MTEKTPRPRGRPRLDPDDDTTAVSVRISTKQYDRIWKQAARDRESISAALRRRLNLSPEKV